MFKHFIFSLGLITALVFGGVLAVTPDNAVAQTSVLAQESSGSGTNPEGSSGSGTNPGGSESGSSSLNVGLENPINIDSIEELILRIVEVVLFILYPIAILAIIYAGFKFITAQGNETEITKAKQLFFWTIIGTGLLIGANVILALVRDTIEGIGTF